MKRALVTGLLFAGLAVLLAQSPAPPAFEAASIKPASRDRVGGGLDVSEARLRIINASLKFCIEVAWNVKDSQVAGGTGWIDSERYEIDAVAAKPFQEAEYRGMLQALLAERFRLAIHRETQERAGYVLVPARGGPKLPRQPRTRTSCSAGLRPGRLR